MKLLDSKRFPEAVIVFAVIGYATTLISSYDIWWHLSLGREVFQTGNLALPDSFSYTFGGHKQFNGEWLANLLFYLSYAAGGLWGIVILKNILLGLTFFTLYLILTHIREEENNWWFIAVIFTLLVTLAALRFRMFIRPYLFSYLCVTFFLYILYRYQSTKNTRLLYWLPGVEIVWANLSSGFFFGPLLVGIFFFAEVLNKKADRHLPLVLIAVFIASNISPELWTHYLNLFDFSTTRLLDPDFTLVGEHQPLTTDLLWGGGLPYTIGFQILLAGSTVYFLFMKGWRQTARLLIFLVFLVPALRWIRMIDFFSLNAAVFFVVPLFSLLYFASKRIHVRKVYSNLTAGVIVFIFTVWSVFGSSTYTFGVGIKSKSLPVEALEWLKENNINGRIFNSYPYGGYISWAAPEKKVFIDGRVNHLYPSDFHQQYFKIITEPESWDEAEEKWDFTVAVLEYDQLSFGRHFPAHLNSNPDWIPVYWDTKSIIFLKRVPKHTEIIQTHGYRIARPYFYDFTYLSHIPKGSNKTGIIQDLKKDIELNPQNQEARLALVSLYTSINFNYYAQLIEKELRACLELKPDMANEHSAMAIVLLNKGEKEEALEETKKALRLNPNDPGAKFMKGQLGL